MKITYIDIDDVLIPTTLLIMNDLQSRGKDKGVTYESLNTYCIDKHPVIGEECVPYFTDSSFIEQIEIEEEVVKALAEIMDLSDITYLYTGAHLTVRKGRTAWYLRLVERLTKYTEKRLVLCYSGWPKIYPPLKFFCVIEDYAEVLIPTVSENKFLVSQPWNEGFHTSVETGNVVTNFTDIPEILRSKMQRSI